MPPLFGAVTRIEAANQEMRLSSLELSEGCRWRREQDTLDSIANMIEPFGYLRAWPP